MVVGIGTDLIEIARVVKACEKDAFLKKYYTKKEIKLVEKNKRKAADNFAVKEAVAKMFGTGFVGFAPIDIEVLRDESGRPYINLYGRAKQKSRCLGISTIHVSITNTKKYSSVFVVGERVCESRILERMRNSL